MFQVSLKLSLFVLQRWTKVLWINKRIFILAWTFPLKNHLTISIHSISFWENRILKFGDMHAFIPSHVFLWFVQERLGLPTVCDLFSCMKLSGDREKWLHQTATQVRKNYINVSIFKSRAVFAFRGSKTIFSSFTDMKATSNGFLRFTLALFNRWLLHNIFLPCSLGILSL